MRQKFHTIRNKRIKLNNSIQIKVSFPFSSWRLIVDIYNRVSEIKKRKGRYTDETKIKRATVNFTPARTNNSEADDYFTLEEGNEFCSLSARFVIHELNLAEQYNNTRCRFTYVYKRLCNFFKVNLRKHLTVNCGRFSNSNTKRGCKRSWEWRMKTASSSCKKVHVCSSVILRVWRVLSELLPGRRYTTWGCIKYVHFMWKVRRVFAPSVWNRIVI